MVAAVVLAVLVVLCSYFLLFLGMLPSSNTTNTYLNDYPKVPPNLCISVSTRNSIV